jgi:hypothetical protein
MPYDCWRGMVGMIKPTKGSGSLIPLFNNVRHGKTVEFKNAISAWISELGRYQVDVYRENPTILKISSVNFLYCR